MINNPAQLTGMVLNGAHGIYDVHTEDGILRCTLRGKLKKAFAQANSAKSLGKTRQNQQRSNKYSSQGHNAQNHAERLERIEKRDSSENAPPTRLSVGDYVKIRRLDETNGLIEEILPRKSELSRMDAGSTAKRVVQQTLLANLNQVVIVFATAQPEPHFGLLDRYLTICESAQLSSVICINKADLPHSGYVEEEAKLYGQLGYQVIFTSTQTEQGIDQLRELLKDHTTLFTGPSGVGKSSLVNAIEPGMAIRTGLVSDATGKGKHTTTGSQLYPLSGGGWLADSAGIRALAAWNIAPEELAECFVEFRPYLGECLYGDCAHLDEDGCAIRQAVNDGHIQERRYRSYVRIYTGEER
ncbi:ribosome small subunit-dependent GTPase A [Dictyobacter aurantiacus]|uniref:Small ribosomal subunit biogenesis GTPase RsgA n=1 Tax=Dictyobacter aurantiacus TaxID=1936993 RepID=A0A401ZDR2_9CHLR|nr:ribosome small subunit-dependent GTPase A [Dictyobacter aurantiacus]GCE05017.1 putative ribosome biogenesis GTPase RsgA [Dictyobacter aurantiacus]